MCPQLGPKDYQDCGKTASYELYTVLGVLGRATHFQRCLDHIIRPSGAFRREKSENLLRFIEVLIILLSRRFSGRIERPRDAAQIYTY